MKRLTLSLIAAVIFVTAGACAPTPHDDSHHENLTYPAMARLDSIAMWLGYGTIPSPNEQGDWNLLEWLQSVYNAICTLETGAGVADGLCTDPDGDPDPTGGPPPSPPWD